MFKSVKISALKGIYEEGFLSGLYQQRLEYDSLYNIKWYRVYRIRKSECLLRNSVFIWASSSNGPIMTMAVKIKAS